MKQFYITSTITIEAESREEADKKLERNLKNENIAWDLFDNAQIDEVSVN